MESSKIRILIAEDERLFRKMLAQVLSGHEQVEVIAEADNGISAFNLIMEHHPDIVITDIRMPGMDGIELIRRTAEFGGDCKFIIVSGYADFEYARSALQLQTEEYLLKPIEPQALLASIDKILARQKQKMKEEEAYRQFLWKGLSQCTVLSESIWVMEPPRFEEAMNGIRHLLEEADPDAGRLVPHLLRDLLDSVEDDITARARAGGLFLVLPVCPMKMDFEEFDAACREIMNLLREKRNHSHSSKIQKCLRLIEDKLGSASCNLSGIAEELEMSPAYLSSVFKKEMGCSFMDYLLHRKLLLAKELLHTNAKIYQISEQLGYEDVAHFSKIFKKHTGMTPIEYRRNLVCR